jgi:hypothetical protein
MAYNQFTLTSVKRSFGLVLHEQTDLFADISPVVVNDLLIAVLAENVPLALAINTEKARSEFIIAPILVELRRLWQRQISLFSGIEFSVDPEQGLSGTCDFIVSQSPEQLILNAPVLVIVEAKNENIKAGLAQCMAEMVAARVYNERERTGITIVYGVVTTGSIWKFLRLEGSTVYVDQPEYYLENLAKILAILLHVAAPIKN